MISDDDGEIGFRGPQVCKLVGISYRQLDYWARTDLIRPSLADAQGSGTQRRYSYRDLVALKVIKSLLDAGVSLQTARKAIEYLRSHMGAELASASLVLNGTKSVLAQSGDDLVDLVRQGQGVLTSSRSARWWRSSTRASTNSSWRVRSAPPGIA
jgi:DNA-binding transcriptional MerR regulator